MRFGSAILVTAYPAEAEPIACALRAVLDTERRPLPSGILQLLAALERPPGPPPRRLIVR